ncbi:MAG: putative glycoside hydrolase, partial [Armatimonadota bacterium]|nr:putative glycoside hydrolase [Armatimonadota bacterium]
PRYGAAWTAAVLNTLQGRPLDGVWIDALPEDLYPYYLQPGQVLSRYPDNASWHAALASFLQTVYTTLHRAGFGVYANNGSDWKVSPWKDLFSPSLDGTYEEGAFFWNSPVGTYVGKNVWDMEIACPSYSPTKNRMAATMIDLTADPLHTPKLRFALASYLLGETTASSFGVAPGNSTTWQWSSDMEVSIGLPTAPATSVAPGLYSRPFAKGLVAANGDNVSHSLTLAAPYQDLDGRPLGPGPVSVGPTTGLILFNRTLPVFSSITAPQNGALLPLGPVTIYGTATDGSGSGIARVDVTTDGGKSWKPALLTKTANGWTWTLLWTPPAAGGYNISSRATTGNGLVESITMTSGVTVSIAANVFGSSGDFETPAPGGKVGAGWNAPTAAGIIASLDNSSASTGKWSQKLVVSRANAVPFQDGPDIALPIGGANLIHPGDKLTFGLDARTAPISPTVPVRNLSLFAYLQFRNAKGQPIGGSNGGMLVLQPLDAAAMTGGWKTYTGVTFTVPATVKDATGASQPVAALDLTLFVGSRPQGPGAPAPPSAGQVWVDHVALWKR